MFIAEKKDGSMIQIEDWIVRAVIEGTTNDEELICAVFNCTTRLYNVNKPWHNVLPIVHTHQTAIE